MPESWTCPNCEYPAQHEFCAACGQARSESGLELRPWLAEAAQEVFSLESKLARTLRALFLQPGHLTLEWLRGRRASYLRPLRLYIIATILLFGMFAIKLRREVTEWRERATAAAPSEQELQNIEAKAEASVNIMTGFLATISRSLFLLLPVFALLLHLEFRSDDRRYLGHLVHALHVHTVLFATVTVLIAFLMWSGSLPRSARYGVVVASFAWFTWYGFTSLRRVYHESIGRTVAKAVLVAVAYLVCFVIVTTAFSMFALR